ncbi:zinc ribbon domain-containing protein [Gimesia aquarii]|uniref:Zinc-ribbon domain-containing protein n=1 Tax=Gimesia aquarii TaxID=2527964 RepID=A0A517VTH5_9PLAN|nr:zinc ribbon domain-containing protein [Gimesia aquarii]QDT96314.1 hypothetical protein V144x_17680 [Gimesia aquarii]
MLGCLFEINSSVVSESDAKMDEDWNLAPDDDYEDAGTDSDEFETATVPCSNCGADVYEEAVACPVCGEYVGVNTHPFSDRPQWWITLGVVGGIATILCLIFLF